MLSLCRQTDRTDGQMDNGKTICPQSEEETILNPLRLSAFKIENKCHVGQKTL